MAAPATIGVVAVVLLAYMYYRKRAAVGLPRGTASRHTHTHELPPLPGQRRSSEKAMKRYKSVEDIPLNGSKDDMVSIAL